MIPEANGSRRRGILFPMSAAEPLARLVSERKLEFDSQPLSAILGSKPDFGGVQKGRKSADPDRTTVAAFRTAAHQVRMLAFLEEAAGLVEDNVQTMRVRSILEWADVLDVWDPETRGHHITSGVKRLAGSVSKKINDNAAALLDELVHEPWEVPRINLLRAGVIDPTRSTSRKKPEGDIVLWDPRLILAAELHESYGWGAQQALDLVDDWIVNGPEGLPALKTPIDGAEPLAAWHAAKCIYEAVHDVFGDENKRARFDLVGDLHRLPTKQMVSEGYKVSHEVVEASKHAPVYEIGFLVSNRTPGWSPDPDAAFVSAGYSLAADLRKTVRRWQEQVDGGPVHVREARVGTGRRVDFVVECRPVKSSGSTSRGGSIHVWFHEVMHPSEWGTRLIFETSSPKWVAHHMTKAMKHRLLLTPTGVYDVRTGMRAPETGGVEDIGPRENRLLEPHNLTLDELLVMQALDSAPAAAVERAFDSLGVQYARS